jgi:rhodanese-related sulfurtransferase
MPREVGRDEMRSLIAEGAQLVEVLPAEEYDQEHLPGAVNIPLKGMTRESTASLRPDLPVIVYCYDNQ